MTLAEIAAALETGAAADIWYDAAEYGTEAPDDPDRLAESLIESTQAAMQSAANILAALGAPVLLDRTGAADGQIVGLEPDGTIIQVDERGEPYSSGESLLQFGRINGDPDPLAALSEQEMKALLLALYRRIWPDARE